MAYATYTTRALVCGNKASHTSDKSYLLFTEDAGMLWATARSVREEKSRQRYALQDFSVIRVSLVRGKSGWRIGSVESQYNAYLNCQTREARAVLIQCVQLLRRFLQGEETVPVVFNDVLAVTEVLPSLGIDDASHLVQQFTLRLLWQLGYIATDKSYQDDLEATDWAEYPTELPPLADRAIKRGLEASHL